MNSILTCFKCWKNTAVLTYEENRIYKVSCSCGCEYDFEHSSYTCAEMYHYKMLELYAEIDKNDKLKNKFNALMKDFKDYAFIDGVPCETCKHNSKGSHCEDSENLVAYAGGYGHCKKYEWIERADND